MQQKVIFRNHDLGTRYALCYWLPELTGSFSGQSQKYIYLHIDTCTQISHLYLISISFFLSIYLARKFISISHLPIQHQGSSQFLPYLHLKNPYLTLRIQVPIIINILLIYQYSTSKQFIFRSPHHSCIWQRPCSSSHPGSCSPSPLPYVQTLLLALLDSYTHIKQPPYPWHRWPLDFSVALIKALYC